MYSGGTFTLVSGYSSYELPYSEDYTRSDFVRQIEYELWFNPDSCFSEMVYRWYNDLYKSLGDTSDFICSTSEVLQSEEAFAEALADFAVSSGRRGGVRLIRQISRIALRQLISKLAGVI